MLEQIVLTKKKELLNYPTRYKKRNYPSRSLKTAIINSNRKLGLIAEVKKASPSKGIIRKEFDPVAIARTYENSGADAISVLTDQEYFLGHSNYLRQIKETVKIPVLRKDFIIDPIQIEESKAIGADAILLIKAILEPSQAKELFLYAKELGLEVLMEVHSTNELDDVLTHFTPDLLGINNRDLNTFKTSVSHTKDIARHVPGNLPFISESGIRSQHDLDQVYGAGATGILVGETLMRSHSIPECIKELFGEEG